MNHSNPIYIGLTFCQTSTPGLLFQYHSWWSFSKTVTECSEWDARGFVAQIATIIQAHNVLKNGRLLESVEYPSYCSNSRHQRDCTYYAHFTLWDGENTQDRHSRRWNKRYTKVIVSVELSESIPVLCMFNKLCPFHGIYLTWRNKGVRWWIIFERWPTSDQAGPSLSVQYFNWLRTVVQLSPHRD